ncbi:Hypothetical protein PHPALM_14035 [Phytophthora palmivora]|uniref:Uncharacterized protein n=1 Tax=Phytophthora palmivora TaxID=4796 RepID=A0A2P4XVT1_9STRA|nr:Hypothetical protein PHPALM_14035 [Phytophthora palmivora]
MKQRDHIPEEEIRIAMQPGVLGMLTVVDPEKVAVKGNNWVKCEIRRRGREEGVQYSQLKRGTKKNAKTSKYGRNKKDHDKNQYNIPLPIDLDTIEGLSDDDSEDEVNGEYSSNESSDKNTSAGSSNKDSDASENAIFPDDFIPDLSYDYINKQDNTTQVATL